MLKSGLCASLGLGGLRGASRISGNILSDTPYLDIAGGTGFDIDACMDGRGSLMISGGAKAVFEAYGTPTVLVMVVSDQCFL